MSGEIMAIEETLWGEIAMEDLGINELISKAAIIIDEISKRYSQSLDCCAESVDHHPIPNNWDATSKMTRREFVAPNGVRPENHRQLWRVDQIETVQALRFAGWSNARIAAQMNRSPRAIEKIINRSKRSN